MITKEEKTRSFQWKDIGDISLGRPNLGDSAPVVAYRLFQFTIRDVLNRQYDKDTASKIFVQAGEIAGEQFCMNMLDCNLEFEEFVAQLQQVLKDNKIGILRIEKADIENLEFVMTVAEDLDCSGLSISDETVCYYDEGFIAGILRAYTGKSFRAKEVDCWATGAKVCRFEVVSC
jgi:uncharacterized protein